MNNSFFNSEHLFIPSLLISVSLHGVLIGATGFMPSMRQVSVQEAPNTLEITAIGQPLVYVLEEEIVTEEIVEDSIEDEIPQEIVLSNNVKKPKADQNVQPTLISQKSQGAVSKAKPLAYVNPAPLYPRIAREKGWEGIVRLNVLVDKEGAVGLVNIQKSTGFEILDEAALKTVEKWKFSPAQSGSMKFSSRVTIPIQFTLIRE